MLGFYAASLMHSFFSILLVDILVIPYVIMSYFIASFHCSTQRKSIFPILYIDIKSCYVSSLPCYVVLPAPNTNASCFTLLGSKGSFSLKYTPFYKTRALMSNLSVKINFNVLNYVLFYAVWTLSS